MSEVTTKSTLRQILHNAGTGSNSQLISIKHSDLRYLLQELLRNLTQARNSPTLTNAPTDNSNYTQTTQHEVNSSSVGTEGKDDADITMFIYLGLFFLWYGGFIYGCLIGMGVYNKRPKSATLYQRFVERGDIREELRKRKEEMVQHRRMQRRASNMSQQTIAGFNLVSYDRSPNLNKIESTASIGLYIHKNSNFSTYSDLGELCTNGERNAKSVSDWDTDCGNWIKAPKSQI